MFSERSLPLALLLAFCSVSCSVKEDRAFCPGYFIMDLSSVERGASGVARWQVDAEGFSESGMMPVMDLPDSLVFVVPRGPLECRVAVTDGSFSFDDGLRIPLGMDCPELYGVVGKYAVDGEELRDTVGLCRQYAGLIIIFRDTGSGFSNMEVSGNVCGFDSAFEPVGGQFSYVLRPDVKGIARLRVPRQMDSSLKLDMFRNDGELRSFAIGNYIEASGYDWSAPSLGDIVLEIDLSVSRLAVMDERWQLVYSCRLQL